MSDRPNPADLRGPITPERKPPSAPEPPAPARQDDLVSDAVPESRSDEETPAERYAKRLKEKGIEESEALRVLDAVFSKGVYTERRRLFGERYVTLGTRSYDDTERMNREIELTKPDNARTLHAIITRHNLAGSIRQLDGVDWPHDGTDAAHDARIAKIRAMPELKVQMLAEALAQFDDHVFTIFSEGSTALFGGPVG